MILEEPPLLFFKHCFYILHTMNILIDFIPFQYLKGVSGAASFTKAVYDEFFMHLPEGVNIFSVYDSNLPTEGRYSCQKLAAEWSVELVDISRHALSTIVNQHHIDVFFLSIGQLYRCYDLTGINCKTIMFIHDIFDIERTDNQIDASIHDNMVESKWNRLKRLLNIISGRGKRVVEKKYNRIISLYTAENTVVYTVSYYSRNSLRYYFPEIKKDIKVCYSPLKAINRLKDIENDSLKKFLATGKKYLLMVSANRLEKNAAIVMKVFNRISKEHPDLCLLTLKYGFTFGFNHIDIDYLSDSDLEYAYEHALALLFPSYFEGFGYPPVEAMKYGTPVIVSNVTSIPEIVGNAGIYFSPFYPADLYHAVNSLLDKAPDASKLLNRYEEVCACQRVHLKSLIEDLLTTK